MLKDAPPTLDGTVVKRIGICAALTGLVAGNAAPPERTSPALAVVIAVDQLRADYLQRFRPYFGPTGFRRLLEQGTEFTHARYRHAITQTAPGHALMVTGVHADVNGIIGNDWFDRAAGEMVNSVEDRSAPLVGIAAAELGPAAALNPAKTGRSPRHLLAPTMGDALKERDGDDSRVITVAGKDRAAILLGGRKADAAYWEEHGRFITSRYYRDKLPPWVAAFNAEGRVSAAFGRVWDRLLPPEVYFALQGPDDAPGEATDFGLGRVFPHLINGGNEAITPAFFAAFANSPFDAELVGAFAERAVVEERLGRHAGTDLLGLSFSQLDAIGHSYGPDSHEVMDSVLRIDRVLAALLDCLDREVGLGRCVIVLTGDHGVAPLPERQTTPGDARMNLAGLDAAVRAALDAAFGSPPPRAPWLQRDNLSYHLRPDALAARHTNADAATEVVKQALQHLPQVGAVFTRAEILAAPAQGDSVLAMTRRSYHAGRDRDVLFFLCPYIVARTPTGTTHGTPYEYDAEVPLVWSGAGIPHETRAEKVGLDDLAPTLAKILGVTCSPRAGGRDLFAPRLRSTLSTTPASPLTAARRAAGEGARATAPRPGGSTVH